MPSFVGRTALVVALAVVLWPGLPTAPAGAAAPAARFQTSTFVYGVIIDTTNPNSMRLAREAGFTHAKMILYWPRLEPSPGQITWRETSENDLDNVMKAAGNEGLPLVLRMDEVPGWAGGSPAGADLDAVERFYAELARYAQGRVVGYEILNEPNLPFEWGGPPDPAAYTRFLQAAYRGVRAGDPNALVIGGGPSPNTGSLGGTVEDLDFLEGMYAAGARGYFDVLGIHNYGGNIEPERDPASCGICFRRAELYRALMVRRGDAGTPVWATQYGWLMDPGRYVGQYDWMKVSPEHQAEYLVRSYRYAANNWPWLTGTLLSNLDASTSPYHTGPEDGLPWFAILNDDHSPRPAYEAFKQMRAEQAEALARQASPSLAAGPSQAAPAQPASASGAADPTRPTLVRVVNTDGLGVSLRVQPSARAARATVAPEGARLEVVGEDRQSEGRTWRNVRQPGGPAGWVAAEYTRAVD